MPASSAQRHLAPGYLTRRWLYLIHRWIGIASCLLFAMWFISGLVMIYVPYPSLSLAETLAGAQPIDWAAVDVPPPIAAGHLPEHLWLEMRDGVPVWRIDDWDGSHRTLAASSAARIKPVNAMVAARAASRFGGAPAIRVEPIARDQWTVASSFDRHRPLWKTHLADDASTVLYVSSSTGSVVQRTTRHQRFWNWFGSVPHWLYPTVLRQDNAAWRQVVMWVSGPCIAAAVTGIWIGILRTRLGRRRFKNGRMTPYRGWMLWHHVSGLTGGMFLLTWIFSGWLSVDPFRIFRSTELSEQAMRHYAAGDVMPLLPLSAIASASAGAVRIDVTDHAGKPILIVQHRDGDRQTLSLPGLSPALPDKSRIVAATAHLLPGSRIVAVETLTAPDAYWYKAGEVPQLPVLRIRFDDPAGTSLHVDPVNGELLDATDARRRTYRWLFDLLHKWDLNALTLRRPMWDLLLWSLSLLGLVTSVSGIWIGWKRINKTASRSLVPRSGR